LPRQELRAETNADPHEREHNADIKMTEPARAEKIFAEIKRSNLTSWSGHRPD